MATQAADEATAESTTAKRSPSRKSTSSNGKRGPRKMTQDHKDKLELGRKQGRIVGDYLDAIQNQKPRRGRPVTPESVKERIEKVNQDLNTAKGIERLRLIQKQMDLQKELRGLEDTVEIDSLQSAFIGVAKDYAERSGMTYEAFRKYGVPPSVLKEAGLTR